eukprot:909168-Heterocapsa_arctica.AAC.1
MASSRALATSGMCRAMRWAANFAMLLGLQVNAFRPGGFVRQAWFASILVPSDGQETTGNLA